MPSPNDVRDALNKFGFGAQEVSYYRLLRKGRSDGSYAWKFDVTVFDRGDIDTRIELEIRCLQAGQSEWFGHGAGKTIDEALAKVVWPNPDDEVILERMGVAPS